MNWSNFIPTEAGPVGIYAADIGKPFAGVSGADVIKWFRHAAPSEQVAFAYRLHDTDARKHWNPADSLLASRLARILGNELHRIADKLLNGER